MVAVGDTLTNKGLSLPEKAVPSDNVPDHGPCPVNAILNWVDSPSHIILDPLITPVGGANVIVMLSVSTQPSVLVTVTV